MANCCEREGKHALAVKRATAEKLGDLELEELCGIFRVLSDPTRMKLVLALTKGEMCVYHLAEVTGGTVSGVSHQLRILREKKIVKWVRMGKNIEYSIADMHILKIIQMALTHRGCAVEE